MIKKTTKSTKKEVAEIHAQALAEISEPVQAGLTLVDKKKVELVEKARNQTTADVIHEIADLKLKFSEVLDELTKNLLHEKEKLAAVQDGVGAGNVRLKEVYDIEAAANSLEVLIVAQQMKKDEFEKAMLRTQESFEEEMKIKKAEWDRAQKEYILNEKEREDQLKKKWARMEEEYDYKYKLKQQQDEDQYALKKFALDQTLAAYKEEAEKALLERETKLAAREQEFASLLQEKANAAAVLDQKLEEARVLITKDLEQKHRFAVELQSKEFDGQLSLLGQKVELLEGKLSESQKFADSMAKQLNTAQLQSQELAKQVIEGASRAKSFVIHEPAEKGRAYAAPATA